VNLPAPRPPRILVYCQSLVGIGHLSATLRVVEQLLPHAEVDLIQGGLDTTRALEHPRFRNLRLPTLLHDGETGGFVDPDHGRDPDTVWAERDAAIAGFLRHPYDAIVVEFYPFGRRRFKPEIQGLFKAVRARAANAELPIFTMVREVLVPRPEANERRMLETVRKHIHTVFVRGDPAVIAFGDTFSLAQELGDKLVHTGYIAPPAPPSSATTATRKPQVLVSQGGGDVGRELLRAAIGAAARLPHLHFLLAAGSRTPPEALAALRAEATSGNVEVVPFLADFPARLAESALSISMGGDNTLMDVITSRTPALAYPYQANPEQGIRIGKFADKGLVHALGPDDLQAERLAARIQAALAAPYPAITVATDGAAVTARHVLAVLAAAPVAAT
jgi:predicted glycosyltransferase